VSVLRVCVGCLELVWVLCSLVRVLDTRVNVYVC